MSEIKLVKRIKYAGDVHAAMMNLGWDAETAAAFLDSIPDVDKEDVFKNLGLMEEAFDMAKSSLAPVIRCKDCKRRGDPDKCPMCYEVPVYQCNGEDSDGELCWDVWEEIEDRTIDDSFCSCGERRAEE